MKNLILLLFASLLTTVSFAQEVRPDKPLDDANIDKFVSSAFDLYDKKNNYPKMMTVINDTLNVLKAGGRVDPSVYDALGARLKTIEEGYQNMQTDYESLSGQGEDMINNASKINPATKVIRATKQVKSAIIVITETGKAIPEGTKTAATLRARFEKLKALNETKQ